jgi:hypothetical protein
VCVMERERDKGMEKYGHIEKVEERLGL